MTEQEYRDLEAEIHTKVFQKPVTQTKYGHYWTDEVGALGLNPVPKYARDVTAMHLVIDRIVESQDVDLFFENWRDGEWLVSTKPVGYRNSGYGDVTVCGKELPLAVCLLAEKLAEKEHAPSRPGVSVDENIDQATWHIHCRRHHRSECCCNGCSNNGSRECSGLKPCDICLSL